MLDAVGVMYPTAAPFLPQYEKETHVEVTLKENDKYKEGFPRITQIRCRKAILAEDEKARVDEISICTCNTVGLRIGLMNQTLHMDVGFRQAQGMSRENRLRNIKAPNLSKNPLYVSTID